MELVTSITEINYTDKWGENHHTYHHSPPYKTINPVHYNKALLCTIGNLINLTKNVNLSKHENDQKHQNAQMLKQEKGENGVAFCH